MRRVNTRAPKSQFLRGDHVLLALRAGRSIDARGVFVIIGPARHSLGARRARLRPAPAAPLPWGPFAPVQKRPEQIDGAGQETPTARWQRLMVAAQAGDQRAYATLLQEAAKFARVIARRYHRDAGAIEDVVQDTLLSMHRIRHTYEPGRPVEPWVAAIAKARAIDALRARKRRAAVEADVPHETVAAIADGSVHLGALEAGDELAAALATLSPGQRAAVRMLKIEELTLDEAARASGQSVPALKSLLHRAMLSLRATLKGGGDV
jgi:RNA polymerase sigma-70 factor (ECF subfamily)